ncbi:MAG: ATP-binding cassette domain-containing protein [Acidobacteria bacterium]|nr:ATP-binding cassette domain-containing protein [Acidobacteriota bacterium]
MTSSEHGLHLREFTVRIGRQRLFHIPELTVRGGTVVGLAGESGSGKTMLLRLAASLSTAAQTTGHCEVAGRIGYIPQDLTASLSPYRPVLEQVAMLAESHEDAVAMLARLGLGSGRLLAAYPHQLSGGERQRVLIAQALVLSPDLILADEPTSQLDAAWEQVVLTLLLEAAREGRAVLFASHREELFQQLGCSVYRLSDPTPPLPPVASRVRAERVLEVQDASKAYATRWWTQAARERIPALDRVSLAIHAGETVALVGPSGAGKSTLARCIARRERLDTGRIVAGRIVAGDTQRPWRSAVQLVSQEPSESLNPRLTVAACLAEASVPETGRWLERLGLPASILARRVTALSEGQRARVALARSLSVLEDGGLLILDESLSGLDDATRAVVWRQIAAMQAQSGMGCLLITHDAKLAAQVAGRVVRLEAGRASC